MKDTHVDRVLPGPFRAAAPVCAALLATVSAACGDGGRNAASQVAAKVNGHEITVHQINHVLRGQKVSADKAEEIKRQVLERLIDQQLARQHAVEKRLDRAPGTMQSIEAAKNEILARAYLEQIAAAQAAPTDDEVKKYYADHPELFAQRQLFGLEEIQLPAKDVPAEFKEHVSRARELREVAAWLKARNIGFGESRGIRAAEQIPLHWLPAMQAMRSGEIRLFESGQQLHAVRLAAVQQAPVDEATAKPRIQQFLSNKRLSEAVADAMSHLRQKSNIEYVGEFSAGRQDSAPQSAARTDPAAQPTALPGVEKSVRGLR